MSQNVAPVQNSFLKLVIHSGCRGSNKIEWIQEWIDLGSPVTAHGSRSDRGDASELSKAERADWVAQSVKRACGGPVHLFSCQRSTAILEAIFQAGYSEEHVEYCPACEARQPPIGAQIADAAELVSAPYYEAHDVAYVDVDGRDATVAGEGLYYGTVAGHIPASFALSRPGSVTSSTGSLARTTTHHFIVGDRIRATTVRIEEQGIVYALSEMAEDTQPRVVGHGDGQQFSAIFAAFIIGAIRAGQYELVELEGVAGWRREATVTGARARNFILARRFGEIA